MRKLASVEANEAAVKANGETAKAAMKSEENASQWDRSKEVEC
jgi:hypothetical protein